MIISRRALLGTAAAATALPLSRPAPKAPS
jgi:hypothetical protein